MIRGHRQALASCLIEHAQVGVETASNRGHLIAPAQARSTFLPETQPLERRLALLIFVATCAYLCFFRRYTSIEPDEGIVLQGARRILRGEVLYHDFFSFFTPGSYYFLAVLFKIFGNSFLVGRVALVVFGGIYSAVTYLLARRVCSRGSAMFAAGLATATTLPYRFEVLHNWDSTLWACLALYCAVRLMESAKWKWAFGGIADRINFLVRAVERIRARARPRYGAGGHNTPQQTIQSLEGGQSPWVRSGPGLAIRVDACLLCKAAQRSSYVGRLVLAPAALFAGESSALRVSELVG